MADSSSGTAGAVPATGRAGDIEPGPGVPTIPIPFKGGPAAAKPHPTRGRVGVTGTVLDRLRSICEVSTDEDEVGEASRDWWPLGMTWALEGELAGRARAVVKPTEATQVGEVLHVCDIAKIPVTAAGGRAGVSGATVPIFGGVILDMCGLSGIRDVDATSLVVDVGPGTFGDRFEAALRSDHGLTCGHWPQSMTLSTVGGWVACRGAGQFSTRYGKIEDMVVGLDVALADGTTITTGGYPRTATGPDLTQLFVGSEGTLGVITGVRLRTHPAPVTELRGACVGRVAERRARRVAAASSSAGRRRPCSVSTTRPNRSGTSRWATAAARCSSSTRATRPSSTACGRSSTRELAGAETLDPVFVGRWLEHRNDVSQLESLICGGHRRRHHGDRRADGRPCRPSTQAAIEAIGCVRRDPVGVGALSATATPTARASTSRSPAGRPRSVPTAGRRRPPRTGTTGRCGTPAPGPCSRPAVRCRHHHGVGLNRSRFMDEALGGGIDV